MRFSDLLLLLGILTAVATPMFETLAWLPVGFEDAAGFHFGSLSRPM
jgi:hypothetical protein